MHPLRIAMCLLIDAWTYLLIFLFFPSTFYRCVEWKTNFFCLKVEKRALFHCFNTRQQLALECSTHAHLCFFFGVHVSLNRASSSCRWLYLRWPLVHLGQVVLCNVPGNSNAFIWSCGNSLRQSLFLHIVYNFFYRPKGYQIQNWSKFQFLLRSMNWR